MAFHYAYSLQQVGREDMARQVLAKIAIAVDKPWLKKRNFPNDYFFQAQSAMVENNIDQALLYLQLAISAGWTSTWLLDIDPAWQTIIEDERLLSLKLRVSVRLANMRKRLRASDSGFSSLSTLF